MKSCIYYFTGTGNNLWTAKKMKEQLGNTDIYPMHYLSKNKEIASEYTHIIFVVPSYYSHIPSFVKDCLNEVVFKEQQKIITIVDCAGNRGKAIEDLRESIQKCGKNVMGEYMVVHSGNYILSYGAFPKIYQFLIQKNAMRRIRKIVNAIKHNHLKMLSRPGMFYKETEEKRLHNAISSFGEIGSHYEVSDECISCGICVKVCPAQNIHIKNGKPEFQNHCQQCMGCIQWCPNRAIDYEGKARERKRYHNEDISLQELIKYNI